MDDMRWLDLGIRSLVKITIQYFIGQIMKNLLVSLGLYTILASVNAAAETQPAEDNRTCQQENSRFTYDHPTMGKLTDLTQFGLEELGAGAEESTTPPAQVGKCPKAKISMVTTVKNWFKHFASCLID